MFPWNAFTCIDLNSSHLNIWLLKVKFQVIYWNFIFFPLFLYFSEYFSDNFFRVLVWKRPRCNLDIGISYYLLLDFFSSWLSALFLGVLDNTLLSVTPPVINYSSSKWYHALPERVHPFLCSGRRQTWTLTHPFKGRFQICSGSTHLWLLCRGPRGEPGISPRS